MVAASSKMLRLGAFMRPVSIHTGAWRYPGAFPDANFNFQHLRRFAQTLERGRFDMFFMADHLAVLNMPVEALKRSHTVTSFEPFTLLSALAVSTERIRSSATRLAGHRPGRRVRGRKAARRGDRGGRLRSIVDARGGAAVLCRRQGPHGEAGPFARLDEDSAGRVRGGRRQRGRGARASMAWSTSTAPSRRSPSPSGSTPRSSIPIARCPLSRRPTRATAGANGRSSSVSARS